jgi:hypothetical protein
MEIVEISTPLSSSNNGDILLPREDKKLLPREDKKSTASSSSSSTSSQSSSSLNPTKNNDKNDIIDLSVESSLLEPYKKSADDFSFEFSYNGDIHILNEKLSAKSFKTLEPISDAVFRLCLLTDGVNSVQNVSTNFINIMYMYCIAHIL